MSKLSKALIAAAGNSGGAGLTVEDVFSTYLYTGTQSTQSITNGIDLDGEGGLVWTKTRQDATDHFLFDTERGVNKSLTTNKTSAENTFTNELMSFNSDGFTLGSGFYANWSGQPYASWTFRKAEKFFDVVTYSGNNTLGRTVAHNLGSAPAFIIVKCTSNSTTKWTIYHSSLGATKFLEFDTGAAGTAVGFWNNTEPTDSVFTLGNDGAVNATGRDYVAYLFASDAGGFGDDGDESIIKCGSYQSDGNGSEISVDLGFEAQFVMAKAVSTTGNWHVQDSMRGMAVGSSNNAYLQWNTSDSESADGTAGGIVPTSNGFRVGLMGDINIFNAVQTYIYIAIRRPMKTPESGTEVFDVNTTTQDNNPIQTNLNTVDVNWQKSRNDTTYWFAQSRLTGNVKYLRLGDYASGESDYSTADPRGVFDTMGKARAYTSNPNVIYSFKRATGFFDMVVYDGDSTSPRNIQHNLDVAPNLLIVRSRSASRDWVVYCSSLGADKNLRLNRTNASQTNTSFPWQNTTPTDEVFTVDNDTFTNLTGEKYIAYLFATLAGVSKVGSYTGTGNSLDIDCGFSNGARFVMIKRTDSSSDWWVWDSARGIVSGNDPTLRLNSTAAETTTADYIDPLSSGFTLTTAGNWLYGMNYPSGNYIFLAIA